MHYNDGFDVLANSTILRENRIPRVFFDPSNLEHVQSLNAFLDTGVWGKIQFYVEGPCTTVPETVLRKVAKHFVGNHNV